MAAGPGTHTQYPNQGGYGGGGVWDKGGENGVSSLAAPAFV